MFWKRKLKSTLPEIVRFPDNLSCWKAYAAMSTGRIQTGRGYVALVLRVEDRTEAGQGVWIRLANSPGPSLDLYCYLPAILFDTPDETLEESDLVLWAAWQPSPKLGRQLNMSNDPRLDFTGGIMGKLAAEMNSVTRVPTVLREYQYARLVESLPDSIRPHSGRLE